MSGLTGDDPGTPDGWHPWRQTPEHTLRDALYVNGLARATVEAFSDFGPWYPNALTPEGKARRGGPHMSHSAAAEWCERVTGYRVAAPK